MLGPYFIKYGYKEGGRNECGNYTSRKINITGSIGPLYGKILKKIKAMVE